MNEKSYMLKYLPKQHTNRQWAVEYSFAFIDYIVQQM